MAMNDDLAFLVHASTIEADVAMDLYMQRPIETDRDGMLSHRIAHQPMTLIGILRQALQGLVDAANANLLQIQFIQPICTHALPPQV